MQLKSLYLILISSKQRALGRNDSLVGNQLQDSIDKQAVTAQHRQTTRNIEMAFY